MLFDVTFVIGIYLFSLIFNLSSFSQSELNRPSSLKEKAEVPERIVVPELNLDLPVGVSPLEKGKWNVFEEVANFGQGSAAMNSESGMTVIFGHAKEKVFSALSSLQKGNRVFVLSNESWYSFEVAEMFYVKPSETGFLKRNLGKGLVLLTCFGEDDQFRLIVVAKSLRKYGYKKTV